MGQAFPQEPFDKTFPADTSFPNGGRFPPVPGDDESTAFVDSISAAWGLDDQYFGATANYESKVADNSLDLTPTNDPLRAPYRNLLPVAQFVDGNSEYLSVADPWTSGDIDYSVGCWVYLDDLTGDLPIASKDDGSQGEWRLYYDDNTTDAWVFEIYDGAGGSNGSVSLTATAPAATTWFFVVGGHDVSENEVNISVNGSAYTTASTTGAGVDTDDPFELGRMGAATYHDGRLSQCFFTKEELSAADLGDLYNNGVPVPSRNFSHRVATAPEGLWDLSELSGTRVDFTSNGNDLTDNATVLHGAGPAPRAYKAADFNRAGNESLTNSGDFTTDADNMTVECWGRPEVLTSANATYGAGLIAYHESDAIGDFALTVDPDGAVHFYHWQSAGADADGHAETDANVAATLNEWYHVVGRRSSGTATIWVNGSSEAFTTETTASGWGDNDFRIGGMFNGTSGYAWDGKVATCRLWLSTAISNAEIGKLYAGGHGYDCNSAPPDVTAPDYCWNLDEPSGTRSASIGSADLTDVNTVGQGDGIADIPGGVTLKAADFEASSSENLSAAEIIDIADGTAFSVGFWTNRESGSNIILGSDSGTAPRLIANASTLFFNTNGGVQESWNVDAGALEQWYSGVVTVSDDATANVNAYWNGEAPASGNPQTSATTAYTFTHIGRSGTSYHDGELQTIALWSGTELTADQAAIFHNSGEALACSALEDAIGVAPTVCCDLDEASGTRTCDIGSVSLIDNNTVGSTGGVIRGDTGHAVGLSITNQTYLTKSYNTIWDADGHSVSWGAWAFLDSSTNAQTLLSNITGGSGYFTRWAASGTKWQTTHYNDPTTAEAVTAAGEWAFVAFGVDVDDEEVWISINGAARVSTSYSTLSDNLSNALFIGALASGSQHMGGAADELLFSDSEWTAAQITCLYNDGKGRTYADIAAGACD